MPRDLDTICLKCLEKNPQHRYATAAELAADLDRFLRHEPIRARPVSPAERGARWIRRNPLPTMLAVTAVALLGFIIGNSLREQALSADRETERLRLTERFESGLQLVQQERFAEAKAILGKLGDGGNEELRRRIDQTLADVKLVEELDAVGVRRAIVTCAAMTMPSNFALPRPPNMRPCSHARAWRRRAEIWRPSCSASIVPTSKER
ncbi:MAG: hypothetical protein QM775_11820 [Pirellulales bacterium]